MEIPFSILITNLISLFLLMVVGFVVIRMDVLPKSMTVGLTSLLMKVALPAMLFCSMIREFDKSFLIDSIISVIGGFIGLGLLCFFSKYAAALFRVPKEKRGPWMFCASFSNNGFMGFPIVNAVLGAAGLGLAVMFNISQNILVYSSGIMLICTGITSGAGEQKFNFKKVFCTMINLSLLLGLIFYCFQIPVPEFILQPLTYLNNLTTPLSMLIIGMNIGAADLKETISDRNAATCALTRLVIFPVILWAIMKLIPFSNPIVPKMILLTCAMPCASVATPLAEANGADAKIAARATFFSTILCVITIPLICLLP